MKKANSYRAYPDTILVDFVRADDHHAYTELYRRHAATLYRRALNMLRDADACNDIIQDLFLTIWAKRADLWVRDSFEGYCYRALKNRVLDYISHEKVVERYANSFAHFATNHWSVDEYISGRELSTIIAEEKAKLPPKTRKAYELSREANMSYGEISVIMNSSEKTVKKQVHNALRVIRLKISSLMVLWFL